MERPNSRSMTSLNSPNEEKYPNGQMISVGAHRVEIVSYLAEGGFAQIYVVKFVEYLNEFESLGSKSAITVGDIACLKRVIVNDEMGLNEMRNEVEVMKKLKSSPNIVQYFDSNASRRTDGKPGFEVLLLMELCPNKSLLDYMNQRLKTKLSESEILKIMYDVSIGISNMHYLDQPLIHRDIKIENVLVDANNNFKLCDMGSTSQCSPPMMSNQDIAMMTQNIYVHTTPQYRAPEMIDLYRYLPINEKSDIWALGIFLYKLLFYTTPFEITGQMAILHSKYDFPPNKYSSKIINLIIIMLAENPNLRPNIFQVVYHICSIMNLPVPIEDRYGLGPYNFDLYTKFQSKVQTIQNQINYLQNKVVSSKSKLSKEDGLVLDELYIKTFEMIPKIPNPRLSEKQPTLEIGLNSPSIQDQHLDVNNKRRSMHESINSRQASDNISQKSVRTSSNTIEKTFSQTSNKEFSKETDPESHDESGEPYFPSVNELNTYLDKEFKQQKAQDNVVKNQIINNSGGNMNSSNPERQKSISSFSSSGKSMKSSSHVPSAGFVGADATEGPKMVGYLKSQNHKSNNPFPFMAGDRQRSTESLNNKHNNYDANNTTAPVKGNYGGIQANNIPSQPKNFEYNNPVNDTNRIQDTGIGQSAGRPQNVSQFSNTKMNFVPGTNMSVNFDVTNPINQHNIPISQGVVNNSGVPSNQGFHNKVPLPNAGSNYIPFPPRPQMMQQSYEAPQKQMQKYDQVYHEQPSQQNAYINTTPQEVQNEQLLIDISPPRDIKRTSSPQKELSNVKTHAPQVLDLQLNEMDISEASIADSSNGNDVDSSLLSSESVDLDVTNRLKMHYPFGNQRQTKLAQKPIQSKVKDTDKQQKNGRRSLDLSVQEVHFNSEAGKNNLLHNKNTHRPGIKGSMSEESVEDTIKSLPPSNTLPRSQSSKVISQSTNARTSLDRQRQRHIEPRDSKSRSRSHGLEEDTSSNGSNSSINISTSNKFEMKRSFAKARQSLDLERARRDAMSRSNSGHETGKRKSLFSMFK